MTFSRYPYSYLPSSLLPIFIFILFTNERLPHFSHFPLVITCILLVPSLIAPTPTPHTQCSLFTFLVSAVNPGYIPSKDLELGTSHEKSTCNICLSGSELPYSFLVLSIYMQTHDFMFLYS